MKINRRYIIILIIIIFIAAFAFLYMNYSKQKNENAAALQSLNNANTTYNIALKEKTSQEDLLTQSNTRIAQLQSDLVQAQQQLQATQQTIPEAIKNVDYDEILYNMAHYYGLEVLNLSVEGPTEIQLNDVTMFLYTFNISVTGDTWAILSYIDEVAKDSDFVTTVIEGITMTVDTQQVEVDEDTTIEVTTTNGDISLSIYGLEEE